MCKTTATLSRENLRALPVHPVRMQVLAINGSPRGAGGTAAAGLSRFFSRAREFLPDMEESD